MLTAKDAHTSEKQKLYEQLRHIVSSTYKVPPNVTMGDIEYMIAVLLEEDLKWRVE